MNGFTRLEKCFKKQGNRKVLIPYITTGYPSLEATLSIMHGLVRAGADIIELGIPFSDPAADGTVVQAAGEYALRQGVSLKHVLSVVQAFREQDQITPIVLMGYANPIERMGHEPFALAAASAGVDGVLVVDYPPEVTQGFQTTLKNHGMAQIFLLAPTTTDERIKLVGEMASGYVYYVSLNGVTGAGHLDTDEVANKLALIREHVHIPIGVGFGIRDAQSAQRIGAVADAVVIGSRLIQELTAAMQAHPADQWVEATTQASSEWLASIRLALDS